jgi:hypothetical protein
LSLSVAVVDNNVVHIRKFTVAPDRGTSIDVSDGVKSGNRIMLYPPADIRDGQLIRARELPDLRSLPWLTVRSGFRD